MRHDFLDRYSRLTSPVHRLPAWLKLGAALLLVIGVVSISFEQKWFFIAVATLLVVTALTSSIPWKFILGRLLMFEPFAVGVAAMALFQHNGPDIFVRLLVKSTLCLATMILLSNTTPFSLILETLKKVHVPPLLITVLALAYRYLFVLIDEGERIQRARRSRTFADGKVKHWSSMATLVGQLFVRSTERAERLYAAMTSRGWK